MDTVENDNAERGKKKNLRQPGVEPGSTAWKAAMLTVIPLTPGIKLTNLKIYN